MATSETESDVPSEPASLGSYAVPLASPSEARGLLRSSDTTSALLSVAIALTVPTRVFKEREVEIRGPLGFPGAFLEGPLSAAFSDGSLSPPGILYIFFRKKSAFLAGVVFDLVRTGLRVLDTPGSGKVTFFLKDDPPSREDSFCSQ